MVDWIRTTGYKRCADVVRLIRAPLLRLRAELHAARA